MDVFGQTIELVQKKKQKNRGVKAQVTGVGGRYTNMFSPSFFWLATTAEYLAELALYHSHELNLNLEVSVPENARKKNRIGGINKFHHWLF